MNPDNEELELSQRRVERQMLEALTTGDPPMSEAARRWFQKTGITPWTIVEMEVHGTETGRILRMTAEEWDEDERQRTCIWCGKVCESVEDLEEHEAECGDG